MADAGAFNEKMTLLDDSGWLEMKGLSVEIQDVSEGRQYTHTRKWKLSQTMKILD